MNITGSSPSTDRNIRRRYRLIQVLRPNIASLAGVIETRIQWGVDSSMRPSCTTTPMKSLAPQEPGLLNGFDADQIHLRKICGSLKFRNLIRHARETHTPLRDISITCRKSVE